ncbi:hypothetical protein D3C79_803060 [compost metagenome]
MVADVQHGASVDQPQPADLVERGEGGQPHPVAQLAAGQGASVGQHPGLGHPLLLADPLVEVGVDGGIVGEPGGCHEPAAPLGPVDEAVRLQARKRLLDGDAGGGEALAQGALGGQLLPRPQLAAADVAAQDLANLFTLGWLSAVAHCRVPVAHGWHRPAAIDSGL